MLRYRLRTLLILLAVLPPVLWFGWTKYESWRAEQERQRLWRELILSIEPPPLPWQFLSPSQPAAPPSVDPPGAPPPRGSLPPQ